MPPIQEQIKNINESVAEVNKVQGIQKLNEIPISSETLVQQPEIKIPSVKPSDIMDTTATLIGGTGDSLLKQLTARQQAETETAQKGFVDTLSEYTKALESQTGLQGFLAEQEREAGLRPLAEQIADLEGQINTERLARANLKTRLESQGGGLKSGAEAEYQNFARESLFRETNAVIQLGVQSGRYSAAQQSAQRIAEAYYQQEQNQLQARKELVDTNRDLFTKAEQRTFDLNYNQAVRQLEQQQKELELLQNTKIEALKMAQMNEAPREIIDAISIAKTPEEIIQAGGQFGNVDMLERAVKRQQLATSRTNQLLALASAGDKKAINILGFDPSISPEKLDSTTKRNEEESFKASSELLRLATEYKSLIDTKGFTNEIFGDKATIGRINSLRSQMTASYKDAKKLGTLDKGLIELMDGILGEKPTSSLLGIGEEGNIFANITGGRGVKISTSMQELIDSIQLENARSAYLLGKTPWSDPLDIGITEETNQQNLNNITTNPLGI